MHRRYDKSVTPNKLTEKKWFTFQNIEMHTKVVNLAKSKKATSTKKIRQGTFIKLTLNDFCKQSIIKYQVKN